MTEPSVELTTVDPQDHYTVTLAMIAEVGDACADLEATTPDGYRDVTLAIADCRAKRSAVEKTRKALKADSLAFGRKVDGIARELKAAIETIESPLKGKKAAVDAVKEAERARKKAEKEAEIAAKLKAEREVEEARLREIHFAAENKLAEEREAQRVEAERLAAERAALDAHRREVEEAAAKARRIEDERLAAEQAERAEAQRVEQEKLAAERAVLEEERQLVELAGERQRAELEEERQRVKAIAKEQADRETAEAKAKADAKETKRRKKAAAALAPDMEKLAVWAGQIREVVELAPNVNAAVAAAVRAVALDSLAHAITELEGGS